MANSREPGARFSSEVGGQKARHADGLQDGEEQGEQRDEAQDGGVGQGRGAHQGLVAHQAAAGQDRTRRHFRAKRPPGPRPSSCQRRRGKRRSAWENLNILWFKVTGYPAPENQPGEGGFKQIMAPSASLRTGAVHSSSCRQPGANGSGSRPPGFAPRFPRLRLCRYSCRTP